MCWMLALPWSVAPLPKYRRNIHREPVVKFPPKKKQLSTSLRTLGQRSQNLDWVILHARNKNEVEVGPECSAQ